MNLTTLVTVLPTLLILSSLVIMASRTLTPVRATPEGKVEYVMRLGLLERLLSQRINVLAICFLVALGGGALGNSPWLASGLGYVALAVMLALLLVPQKVVFTSAGVMPTRAIFRPWKDFEACEISGRRIILRGPSRLTSLRLVGSPQSVDRAEQVVRRHLGASRRTTATSSRSRSRRAGA